MAPVALSKTERACLERLVRTGWLSVDQLFHFKHEPAVISSLEEKGMIQVVTHQGDSYAPSKRGRQWLKDNPK